jgi:hypothetical protein
MTKGQLNMMSSQPPWPPRAGRMSGGGLSLAADLAQGSIVTLRARPESRIFEGLQVIAHRLVEITRRVLLKNLRNTQRTRNVPTEEPYGGEGTYPPGYAKREPNSEEGGSMPSALTVR